MRILTLDQSSNTGWATGVERSDERWEFGSFKVPKRDDRGARLVIFRDGLVELIEKYQPDLVGYETPFLPLQDMGDKAATSRFPMNPKVIKLLLNLEGVLIETTARYGIPTEDYPSSSWRHTALGFGRKAGVSTKEWKDLMIGRAIRLGYKVRNDNEADAIGLLIHMLQGQPAMDRAQGDLLARAVSSL